MALILYNTLSRQKEEFIPIEPGQADIYSCGPTVYLYAHIGNLRAYIFSDTLRRALEYFGYEVKQVVNVTDVGHLVSDADQGEDKIEKEARKEQKTAAEITEFYFQAFRRDLDLLNIKTENTLFPRATTHINEQIDLIKSLEEKGYTYRTQDGIYFDTSKYDRYGELGQLDLEGQQEGARVDANPEKKNPTDFALWKFSRPEEKRQQEWESPWGVGFPGWHIECSAMSMKYLGPTFDIHTGGIDHIPVHHTNERAQSEAATGSPFVHYWLHSNFLLVENQKMAKSLGNVYLLSDLSKQGIDPLSYRYWLLTSHYRTQANFTWEAVRGAQIAYQKLIERLRDLSESSLNLGEVNQNYQKQFEEKLSDDLNTPAVIALIWELHKDDTVPAPDKLATILNWDKVLGLNLDRALTKEEIPAHIAKLVAEREEARQNKNWQRSDELRDEIRQEGFEVLDTEAGPKIKRP